MNGVKFIPKYSENVLSRDLIGLMSGGYPTIKINRKQCKCHSIAFEPFFTYEYTVMKRDEMILHINDDKMDFRPYKLRVGTGTDNMVDGTIMEKFIIKKTARVKCSLFIDGIFEREHDSQSEPLGITNVRFPSTSYL